MVRIALAVVVALALVLVPAVASSDEEEGSRVEVTAGHSAYAVVETSAAAPPPLLGLAVCRQTVGPFEFTVSGLLGLVAGCAPTAEAWATVEGTAPPAPGAGVLETGRTRTETDAFGTAWITREVRYELPDGRTTLGYAVPLGEQRTDPQTGEAYNFVLALPALPRELAGTSFTVSAR